MTNTRVKCFRVTTLAVIDLLNQRTIRVVQGVTVFVLQTGQTGWTDVVSELIFSPPAVWHGIDDNMQAEMYAQCAPLSLIHVGNVKHPLHSPGCDL